MSGEGAVVTGAVADSVVEQEGGAVVVSVAGSVVEPEGGREAVGSVSGGLVLEVVVSAASK